MALGIDSVRIGSWQNPRIHTGCTVVIPPDGSLGAIAVRGGSPGTREAAALGPFARLEACHAVVLTGGSAYGLAAADGVAGWCEDNGIGLRPIPWVDVQVPVVGAAALNDLYCYRPGERRPDAPAGREAADTSTTGDLPHGSVGAGTGCVVAHRAGTRAAVKGGQGWAVEASGSLVVGAVVAVNAMGDIVGDDGQVIAASRAADDLGGYPLNPWAAGQLGRDAGGHAFGPQPGQSTVIGCVVTNGRLSKLEAYHAAELAHHGIVRAVRPAHTQYDGDTLFLLSTRERSASADAVGLLAARAVAAAIRSGVVNATAMPGFPAATDPRASDDGRGS